MYTRKFFVGAVPSFGAGVVHTKGEQENKDGCDDTKKLIRPRELPLYVDPPSCVACSNTIESDDGFLLTTIRCARQEFQQILEQARMIKVEASNVVGEVQKETKDVVNYLREEENLLPRLGAVGLGGFAGYLVACRKGWFKKTFYSTAGATLIAALAYPNEAREITEEITCEMKKYAVIGYHFLNGADVDWKKLDESCKSEKRGGVQPRAGKAEIVQKTNKQNWEDQNCDKNLSGPENFKNYTERCRERGGSCSKRKGESKICNDTKSTSDKQTTPILTRPTDKRFTRGNCSQYGTIPVGRPAEVVSEDSKAKSTHRVPQDVDKSGQTSDINGSSHSQLPMCSDQGGVRSDESTCLQSGETCLRKETSTKHQQRGLPNWTQKCDCSDEESGKAEITSPASEKSSDPETQATPCPTSVNRNVVTIRYPDSRDLVVVKDSEPTSVSHEKTTPQEVHASNKFPSSQKYKPFTPLKFWGRDQR